MLCFHRKTLGLAAERGALTANSLSFTVHEVSKTSERHRLVILTDSAAAVVSAQTFVYVQLLRIERTDALLPVLMLTSLQATLLSAHFYSTEKVKETPTNLDGTFYNLTVTNCSIIPVVLQYFDTIPQYLSCWT